jgi:hypothetical protein
MWAIASYGRRVRARGAIATVLGVVVAVASATAGASAGSQAAAHAAASGVEFGVYTPKVPAGGLGRIDALAQALGRPIDIVEWYQAWGGGSSRLDASSVTAVTATGREPLITWEPWVPNGVVDQPVYRLSRIADGAFDDYVRSWATSLAALGQTVYLRPLHEMNGNWVPWGGTVNGNSPAEFVRAWRHLHDVFVQAGATNVKWVWAPTVDDWPATSANRLERYYPGARYVDVLGVDAYNYGETPGHTWRSFADMITQTYGRLARLGPQPLWLTETASAAKGGDKAAWIRDMFQALPAYPRIRAIVWLNAWKKRDWRADSSPATTAAFALPRPGLRRDPNAASQRSARRAD